MSNNALSVFGGGGKISLNNMKAAATAMQQSANNDPRGSADGSEYLNFSGKRGVYELGQNKENVPADEVWIVNVASFSDGWVCWKGGRPVAKRFASIFADPIPAPDPEEHGPFDTRNGEGWYQAKSFQLKSLDTDTEAIFTNNSKSGVSVFAGLQREVSEKMMSGRPFWPIIQLDKEVFSAQGQKNYKPKFNIYGWLGTTQVEKLAALEDGADFDLDALIEEADALPDDFADASSSVAAASVADDEVADEAEEEAEANEPQDEPEVKEAKSRRRRTEGAATSAEKKGDAKPTRRVRPRI